MRYGLFVGVGLMVVTACAEDPKVCPEGYGLAADDNCYPLAELGGVGDSPSVDTGTEALSVRIGPGSALTDTTLWSRVKHDETWTDKGEVVEGFRYTWYVDGEISGEDNAQLRGDLYFERDQTIQLVVSVVDGGLETAASNILTVANTAPGAPVVHIEPAAPQAGTDDLECVYEGSLDADSDTLRYRLSWSVDGVDWPSTDDVIPAAETTPGQQWTCSVSANDGHERGPSAEAMVQVRDVFAGWPEQHVSLGIADYVLHGENPSDFSGASVAGVGDVDGDGRADMLVPSYFYDGVGENSGKVYLVRAADLDAPGDVELADMPYQFTGASEDEEAGHSANGAGDVDGDGLDDLLICGYRSSDPEPETGRIYLMFAEGLGAPGVRNIATADIILVGEAAEDRLGHHVTGIGDADGDGIVDVLTGAYGNDSYGDETGKSYLIPGSSLVDFRGERVIGPNEYTFVGEEEGDESGHALRGARDVDGDGLSDFVLGARLNDLGATDGGKAYLILGANLGAPGEIVGLENADYTFYGEASQGWVGYQLTGVGDVDGDGLGDLLIGAYGSDDQKGRVYLVMASSIIDPVQSLEYADVRFVGEYPADQAGHNLSSAGDVDGDDRADVIIGARNHGDRYGAAYLVLGQSITGGIHPLADADYIFEGEKQFDEAGYSVSSAGDVNRDGLDDLLVAAWQGNFDSDSTDPGKTYLLLAPGGVE
jgi:hypothetical protein